MPYREVNGDLIYLAKGGNFDVIVHGCNCFCAQASGIAKQMVENFGTNLFNMEQLTYENEYGDKIPTNNKGNINKLGQIDYQIKYLWFKHPMLKEGQPSIAMNHMSVGQEDVKKLIVINAYTQYYYKTINPAGYDARCLDYEALTMCMRKLNHIFKGKRIGLPKIGSALAGGNWTTIREIIQAELKDCIVTVVNYNK